MSDLNELQRAVGVCLNEFQQKKLSQAEAVKALRALR
jgi:hypothetical protein